MCAGQPEEIEQQVYCRRHPSVSLLSVRRRVGNFNAAVLVARSPPSGPGRTTMTGSPVATASSRSRKKRTVPTDSPPTTSPPFPSRRAATGPFPCLVRSPRAGARLAHARDTIGRRSKRVRAGSVPTRAQPAYRQRKWRRLFQTGTVQYAEPKHWSKFSVKCVATRPDGCTPCPTDTESVPRQGVRKPGGFPCRPRLFTSRCSVGPSAEHASGVPQQAHWAAMKPRKRPESNVDRQRCYWANMPPPEGRLVPGYDLHGQRIEDEATAD